jgi:hypothetical protein
MRSYCEAGFPLMGVEKILRHFEHNISMTNEDAKKRE